MSLRLVSSISGIITNSSTEVFMIQGPDALRQMVGSGVYRKYKDRFFQIKTEEDVESLVRYSIPRHSYVYIGSLGNKDVLTYRNLALNYPELEEKFWEIFKPIIIKSLNLPIIIYYDYINNQRILNRLLELYPNNDGEVENEYYYRWSND